MDWLSSRLWPLPLGFRHLDPEARAEMIEEVIANAHQELIGLQHNLEEQQVQINNQRDQLESERREIANQRHRDPVIAAAISNVGLVLACLIPLTLAGYLLYCLRDRSDDEAVGELLIQELTSDRPLVLPLAPDPATDEGPSLSEDGPRPSLPRPET